MDSVTIPTTDKNLFKGRCVCCGKGSSRSRRMVPETPNDLALGAAGCLTMPIPFASFIVAAANYSRSIKIPLCWPCRWNLIKPLPHTALMIVMAVVLGFLALLNLKDKETMHLGWLYLFSMMGTTLLLVLIHGNHRGPEFPVSLRSEGGLLFFTIHEDSALFPEFKSLALLAAQDELAPPKPPPLS